VCVCVCECGCNGILYGMLQVVSVFQLKCHQYYPTGTENEGEDEVEFEDVGLKVTYVEEKESNVHYTARVFYVTDTEVQHEHVHLIMYAASPKRLPFFWNNSQKAVDFISFLVDSVLGKFDARWL